MSNNEKREKGSPGDVELNIDEALAGIIDQDLMDAGIGEETDSEWEADFDLEGYDESEFGDESGSERLDEDAYAEEPGEAFAEDAEEDGSHGEEEAYEDDVNDEYTENSGEEAEDSAESDDEQAAAPKRRRRAPKKVQGKSARPKQIAYVPISDEELETPILPVKKKYKGLKITGISAAMLVIAAGCAYAGMSYYYSDKFFEGTTINGIDCSGKTAFEAEQAIAKKVEDYSIEVMSRNLEPQVIDGSKIGYTYLSNGEILKLLKQQKPYEWIRGFFETKTSTASENVTFDKALLQAEVKQLNCAQKENQVEPENAYVAFKDSKFKIVPETKGSKLKVKKAYKVLGKAIAGSEASVDFNSSPEVYETAAVTRKSPELKATRDAYNNYTKASITYTFGEETVTLDGTILKEWLQFDEKGQLVQNDASFQQHIAEYVAQLAAAHDTAGTQREFQTTSGRTVYVYGSAYGWKIDQAAEIAQLTKDIQTGTQTTREPVYSMTANSHGYNDFGNTYMEVDLSGQHMYYYQDGGLIFETDFVSGNMSYADRQTPEGVYTLYYKKSPDVLRGKKIAKGKYEYEQPVDYWMPFNGGVGFHDANWQPYFGGDRYLTGGSHGCINLPPSKAAELYSIIQYNVPIICFY